MSDNNLFKPRPQIDKETFVTGGQIHELSSREAPAPTVVRHDLGVTASPRIQQGVGSHSYKHITANFMRLRRLAQKLDVPVGRLLDEAIEAKLPEFEERAGKVDW